MRWKRGSQLAVAAAALARRGAGDRDAVVDERLAGRLRQGGGAAAWSSAPTACSSPGPAASVSRADSLRTMAGRWRSSPTARWRSRGDHGRVERWTAKDGMKPWVRLGAGQVLCLARDGDGLLAGTGPNGLVYRISAKGDTTLVAATGERYVWALVRRRARRDLGRDRDARAAAADRGRRR